MKARAALWTWVVGALVLMGCVADETGAGAATRAGAETGAGAATRAGAEAGAGAATRAGAATATGAGAATATEAGAGTEAGTEAGAGAEAGAEAEAAPAPKPLPDGWGVLAPGELLESRARWISQARLESPGVVRPFVNVADRLAAREESLAFRASRRSYEGAPPPLGHSAIFGEGSKSCLDCHRDGMRIGDRVARPMAHAELGECLQCHVESAHREFGPGAAPVTSFEGARSGGGSAETLPLGMPPPMPHGLVMRGRCLSCHGEYGYEGLRTTHPRRAQCVQCHVGSSAPFAHVP